MPEPTPTATAEPETTAAATPTAEPETTAAATPTAEPEPAAVPSEEKEDETKVSGAAAIGVATSPALGDMLVDSEGLTLYRFTVDERNKSNCTGGCATAWPPLLTIGDPTAGEGVSADHLGTLERDDGSTQVTYNGWPLYYFGFDNAPGDANGQDSRDVWYVVSPFGGPLQSNALVNVAAHDTVGTVLADRSGRTQYLFTPDNRGVSNCTGGCAMFWPPLLTIGDPTAGEGVSADHLGTLERDDGSTQVTYNGWPLYYFGFDDAPGDANGQDSRDVWYVVSTFGGPIQSNVLVNVAAHDTLGTVLADRSGRTQYLYTPDNRGVTNCTGVCAMFWPPLLTIGDPTAGEGVSADHLGTLERDDGSTQATYNGWPLYYFAFDNAPGDANGQDSRDVWYVVSTFGGPIQSNVLVNVAAHDTLGTVLAERSGRTQYLFTPDNRGASTCVGGCAMFWPPLLTIGDPTAGEGVSPDHLGTVVRDDGSTQVTYNGWPIYYFAFDNAPGDANGQASRDVWYVISNQTPLSIALGELNDSGQTGWATLIALGDRTQVTLSLSTGAMQTELVHIHTGSCGDTLGGVAYPLTSFVDGAGESITVIGATLDSLRSGGFAINSHQTGNPGTYTTCGNLPIEADALTISLNEIDGFGQSGWATLTARGSKTEVVLSLSPGALQTELVHIHSGQCGDNLGGVAHGLTSFAGGSGGSMTTVDASLSSLRTGDFAINAHQAGSPGTYTACGNIPAGQTQALLIMLNEQNSSGQTGWATLTARGDQTVVALDLSSGTLETELVHIHTGSCGDTLGGVAHGLNSFVDGSGSSVTTVGATLDSLRSGGFAINSHQTGNPGTYTSCGNIPIEADALTISLDEIDASGQSGWATLTARGGKTEVVLSLSPGALQTELVHIHSGQCGDTLGGVAHGLTSFAGGSGGSMTTVDASLSSLRTGDFAINAHQAGSPGTYTACGNIPELILPAPVPVTLDANIRGFQHVDLTVQLGTTVKWTNRDGPSHTVTAGSDGAWNGTGFDSGSVSQEQTFEFTFDTLGTFAYTCTIHPSMNATITVQ